jgi:two-component system CheB/CheR fusion protein
LKEIDMSRRQVLVVDDCSDTALTYGLILQAEGYAVHVAYAGAQALQLAASTRPDVVLLDLDMPGLDGLEVCRRLRTEDPDGRILVIAISGWTDEVHRRMALQVGFDHYLIKPANIEHLCRLIGQAARLPS